MRGRGRHLRPPATCPLSPNRHAASISTASRFGRAADAPPAPPPTRGAPRTDTGELAPRAPIDPRRPRNVPAAPCTATSPKPRARSGPRGLSPAPAAGTRAGQPLRTVRRAGVSRFTVLCTSAIDATPAGRAGAPARRPAARRHAGPGETRGRRCKSGRDSLAQAFCRARAGARRPPPPPRRPCVGGGTAQRVCGAAACGAALSACGRTAAGRRFGARLTPPRLITVALRTGPRRSTLFSARHAAGRRGAGHVLHPGWLFRSCPGRARRPLPHFTARYVCGRSRGGYFAPDARPDTREQPPSGRRTLRTGHRAPGTRPPPSCAPQMRTGPSPPQMRTGPSPPRPRRLTCCPARARLRHRCATWPGPRRRRSRCDDAI
jgi:hypothetical protein